jgi:hypothetical protein
MPLTDKEARETFAQFEYRNTLCSNHWLNPSECIYRRGRNRCKKCGKHPLRPNMNEMDALLWFTMRPTIIRQFEMASALYKRMG